MLAFELLQITSDDVNLFKAFNRNQKMMLLFDLTCNIDIDKSNTNDNKYQSQVLYLENHILVGAPSQIVFDLTKFNIFSHGMIYRTVDKSDLNCGLPQNILTSLQIKYDFVGIFRILASDRPISLN